MSVATLGLPFIISGLLKIPYDLVLWRTSRHVHPPEEQSAALAREA